MVKVRRIDPTRTTLLRRSFEAELRRRLVRVKRQINEVVRKEDAFGLAPSEPFQPPTVNAGRFSFLTKDEKLRAFNQWLQQQIDADILESSRSTRPWLAKYIESAYKKGLARAYFDSKEPLLKEKLDFYQGTREQFLQDLFNTAERTSKVRLVYTRAYEELKGVSSTMAQQMSRVMADGLAHGKGPYDIARTLNRTIAEIDRKRARLIARTEVIHAHAEGQLDGFEDLGVEEVGIEAEWATAGDELVCPRCEAMEGKVFKVSEARGLIPLHPNCRCAWIPVIDTKRTQGRKRRLAAAKSRR